MKFTFNWLREFVAVDVVPDELSRLLTMAGLEVESVTPLGASEDDENDWLFEISVTPNRGDCLSVKGLAREVAALTGTPLRPNSTAAQIKVTGSRDGFQIKITNPELCPRYSALVLEDVRIGESPKWMRHRLQACGFRSVNNVVDVTNYVMMESGQPLHAFDLDRLSSGQIVVRPAGGIKKLVTLDAIERELSPEDLLICDGDNPIALAGVMGGQNSEVGATTRRILLESAQFNPIAVRRTAKRLGLHSEASHRFERGVDPAGTIAAATHAAELIARTAGASVPVAVLDSYPKPPQLPAIILREDRIQKVLGCQIPRDDMEKILTALGLPAEEGPFERTLLVSPPTTRPDLTREADLIEEVARLYGYQNIPSTLPMLRTAGGRADDQLIWERRTRSFLTGEGLVEVINLPFTSETTNRTFQGLWNGSTAAVPILNPLVKDSTEMRLSLLPGLLENFRLNLAQRSEGFSAYHLGKTFRLRPSGEIEEKQCLAALFSGPRRRRGLRRSDEPKPITFLECKGTVEGLLDLFHVRRSIVWSRANIAVLHPGRAAELLRDGEEIGYVGESHPDLKDRFNVPSFVAFELDFEKLLQYSPRQIRATALPRYPAVERDFALIVDQSVPSQQIIGRINELGQNLIERVEVFDEYRGEPIPEGKKSLAYKISYRADDRTLTDSEVNLVHQNVVNHLGMLFDAQRRS